MPEHMPAERTHAWCLENYEPPVPRDPWDATAQLVEDLTARTTTTTTDQLTTGDPK